MMDFICSGLCSTRRRCGEGRRPGCVAWPSDAQGAQSTALFESSQGGKATRGFFLSPVDRIARTQPLMGKTVGGPRRRELHAVIPRNDIASAVR